MPWLTEILASCQTGAWQSQDYFQKKQNFLWQWEQMNAQFSGLLEGRSCLDTGLVLSNCRWLFHQYLKTLQNLTPYSTTPPYTSLCPVHLWWFIFFCPLWRCLWLSPFCSFHLKMFTEPILHVRRCPRHQGTAMNKKHAASTLIEFSFQQRQTKANK